MPLEHGAYELRYVQNTNQILARRPISVTRATATLEAPETASPGETIEIAFTGPPAGRGDLITVTTPDDAPDTYNDFHYASQGSPASLEMPEEPGVYELRYVQANTKVLERRQIEVAE